MKKLWNRIANIFSVMTVCVVALFSAGCDGGTMPPPDVPVAEPKFSIAAGEVDYGTKVSISTATEGASIYYTTDGSEPTTTSTKYESEIEITAAVTIKAIAVKSGLKDSEVTSASYTIKLYTVKFDANGHGTTPDAMTGYKGQKITLPAALTETGVTFDKWTDGTTDYDAGAEYTVNESVTLKAKWVDWNTVASPSFSTAAGEVDYGTKVSIFTTTEGASIYYTTDGSEPTTASTKYESEIEITAAVTIKAIAVKSGLKESEVAAASYTIKLYTITFDANGHGTAPDAMTGKHKDETITLPAALTETGWGFVNWNDGTTDYAAGADYTVRGDITIKAVWKEIPNVTNLSATCIVSGTVKLTWINPSDADFAKVVITYGTNGSVEVLKTDSPNNQKTITGLTNGTQYTFTVKAYDNANNASSGVSVNIIVGNGGLVGTPTNGQIQGALAKETWMASNGNLMIKNASDQKVEITKTSEVVVIPTGTIAKINMFSEYAPGSLFTTTRKVKLSSFVMSQYQVTRGLFKAVMGEEYFTNLGTQATAHGTPDENPVTMINWFDAIVFCNKLSSLCGLEAVYSYDFSTDGSGKMTDPEDWFKDTTNLSATVPTSGGSRIYDNWRDKVVINLKANGYRLPTEAEWEFCARGGNPNEADWKYAFSGSNDCSEVAWSNNESGTKNVGGMNKANRLGLYDMSGNVWEWCDDYISNVTANDTRYTDSEGYVKDPLVVSVSSNRSLRGGCWSFGESFCECGYRFSNDPYYRYNFFGFRLVRSTN